MSLLAIKGRTQEPPLVPSDVPSDVPLAEARVRYAACRADRAEDDPSPQSGASHEEAATSAQPQIHCLNNAEVPFQITETALLRLEAGLRAQREELLSAPSPDAPGHEEAAPVEYGSSLVCEPKRAWFYILDTEQEHLPRAPQLHTQAEATR